MKNFAVTIPREELSEFTQACEETIERVEIRKQPLTPSKYLVTVLYPEWVKPRVFVDLGKRFQELVAATPK